MNNNKKIIFLNIIFPIIILFIVYVVINNLYFLYKLNNKKNNFIDANENTITQLPEQKVNDENVFKENKSIAECNAGNDVYGYCLKYDNCCGGTMKNSCFCKNPIVLSCKKEYDKCMKTPNLSESELLTKCEDENKNCCSEYKNNIIDTNNFNKSVNGEQKDNIICNMTNVKNIDMKCLELCQTDPKCLAYTLSDSSCTLHNKITYDPLQNNISNKIINNNYKFFTKKII
jgi:hypothetical protein